MSPLITSLGAVLPARQVIHDELRRLAYGTDASFYRLTPEVITLELASRFLTDHLLGDKYFRTKFPGHNLVRARNQLALLKSM